MTEYGHSEQADAGGGALRADRRRRLSWGRVLPGSVVVFAALTMPEFSVGAGDLGVGQRHDDPITPPATTRLGGIKPVQAGAGTPLAGVRYAPLLSIAETPAASFVMRPEISARPAGLAAADRIALAEPSQPEAEPVELTAKTPAPARVTRLSALPVAAAEPSAPLVVAPSPVIPTAPVSLSADDAGDEAFSSLVPVEQVALVVIPVPAPGPAAAITAMPGALPDSALEQIVPAAQALAPVTMPPATMRSVTVPPAAATASVPAVQVARPQIAAAMAAKVVAPAPVIGAAPASVRPPSTKVAAAPAKAPAAAPAPVSRPTAPTAALVAVPAPRPPLTATAPGASVPQGGTFPLDITARLVTRVDGKAAGAVDFRQTATGLSVRLGSIVDVLGDRYDPAQIARIRASAANNLYLSLAELQAQGIPISYDPVYDEFNVGLNDTRPKAARKVHMDQISAPERGLGSAGIDQVRR